MKLLLHNIDYFISLQEKYSQKLVQENKNNIAVTKQLELLYIIKEQAEKVNKQYQMLEEHFATKEEKSILQALYNTTVFTSNNELRGELYKIIYHADMVNADFEIWKEQKRNDRKFILSLFEILDYNPDNVTRMKGLLKNYGFDERIYLELWKQNQAKQ
ncbi:MAG: hypothetical protein U0L93_05865 [Bacteroidales bacterium]|nr:hypothetical protein [Bacteroidales bacterium]